MYAASFICCSRLICNSMFSQYSPSTLLFAFQSTPLTVFPSTHFCYFFHTVCLPIYLHSNLLTTASFPSHPLTSPHLTSPHSPPPPSPHLPFLIPFHPLMTGVLRVPQQGPERHSHVWDKGIHWAWLPCLCSMYIGLLQCMTNSCSKALYVDRVNNVEDFESCDCHVIIILLLQMLEKGPCDYHRPVMRLIHAYLKL